jgi:beta-phosphoglucomutase-like phosphatase (HAD superfamily)
LKAAEKLQLKPGECIVIEDAANGVKAAKNAGMKCVALASHHTIDSLQEADLIIDTFENLSFPNVCFQLGETV